VNGCSSTWLCSSVWRYASAPSGVTTSHPINVGTAARVGTADCHREAVATWRAGDDDVGDLTVRWHDRRTIDHGRPGLGWRHRRRRRRGPARHQQTNREQQQERSPHHAPRCVCSQLSASAQASLAADSA
jgi:hypothetical protein